MEQPKLLSIQAVKIMLKEGVYLREIARASGYTINELSVLNKFLGLKRKRGPKSRMQIANE
jgi:hypothetical protein